ncbi:expressed unknown protein [Seminavis robusta]|uniref:Fe2OG dioxygenase domain-containing protein n=1 Tax=Seminavis robusta TaxID=568900 RepID=A0A9N8HXF9_9STRA|nr:expressed unknown protein [Seminavis robusta]|eukprot:Sro3084_g343380.1 n/a (278) ;mRNA; f:4906-5739
MKQTLLLLPFLAGACRGWVAQRPGVGGFKRLQKCNAQTAFWQEFSTLDGIDEEFAEQQWYLPSVVERALIDEESSVNPHHLLQSLDMSTKTREQALGALAESDAIDTYSSILTRDECYILQTYLLKNVEKELGIDNVDDCADWQVNLDVEELERLIGSHAVDRLFQVPSLLEDDPAIDNRSAFERVGIFIRVYERSPQGRPWMPFHSDGNAWTVNVALNDDADYEGGRLMALTDGALQVVERGQGDATCHRGSVYHAVSAMKRGKRYSMILFFHTDS